ncbi:hypothetical protein A3A49_01455 [Candidatus Curtissbacteria bacterium RIFCSPLOWO2_01_FULL_38_11b]|uniref:Exosortase/archaeosortase family protein n=1 Tax=Candidatus Curtissbacteria bacterium RIFCSPLOWO2_01_FULL_38_11b TaxID=1797725 RepID=A0A1F5H3B7_9BACT|nr:MAG: hypothetical protein A3A49_01455 [Candidatus Curtissbacteria bacterium RIFCSPLOWO2_01_FULL_38_11b]
MSDLILREKNRFSSLFLMVALLLMVIPFISTFNEFLTKILLNFKLYALLESVVVPYEAKVVAGFYNMLGITAAANNYGVWVKNMYLEIQWNCLGWQSVVLLIASYITGFQGKFTLSSRIEVIIIGFMGVYLINMFRILIVGLLATFWGKYAAFIFHDWLSLVFVIGWFFAYWWFSYSFVLEEEQGVKYKSA